MAAKFPSAHRMTPPIIEDLYYKDSVINADLLRWISNMAHCVLGTRSEDPVYITGESGFVSSCPYSIENT